jgi:hypothetical protein
MDRRTDEVGVGPDEEDLSGERDHDRCARARLMDPVRARCEPCGRAAGPAGRARMLQFARCRECDWVIKSPTAPCQPAAAAAMHVSICALVRRCCMAFMQHLRCGMCGQRPGRWDTAAGYDGLVSILMCGHFLQLSSVTDCDVGRPSRRRARDNKQKKNVTPPRRWSRGDERKGYQPTRGRCWAGPGLQPYGVL